MAGLSNLEQTVAKLEAATEACREATRDAHAAIKDLKGLLREVNVMCEDPPTAVADHVRRILEAEAARQIEAMTETVKHYTDEARARVEASFNELENIFMGLDRDPPLETLVRKHVEVHGPGTPISDSKGRKR